MRAFPAAVGERWRAGRGLILGGLLVLSLVPRLVGLGAPLLDSYAFRQTQTALTAKEMATSGIDLLDAELPLFGPPWQVPFELPLFQAAVAAVHGTGLFGSDLDLSCRATGLAAFYLSAIVLYLLARHFLARGGALAALGIYLFTPFNVFWSRACMIDYASVAFALAYLLAVARWSRPGASWAWTAGAVVAGALAGLVKITTVAAVVPALVAVVLARLLRRSQGAAEPAASRWRRIPWLALLQAALFAALPLAVSYAWIAYTDTVKAASFPTRWLTSEALEAWTWGTWDQRARLDNWIPIVARVVHTVLPGPLLLLPLVAVAGWRRLSTDGRLLLATALAGCALPVVLFFNLYAIHEYYLMAVTPLVALVAGIGLHVAWSWAPRRSRWVAAVVLLTLAGYLAVLQVGLVQSFRAADHEDYEVLQVAGEIRRAIPPQEPVLMTQAGWDWDPAIPYYADRRFLIVRQPWRSPELDRLVQEAGFRHAVLHFDHPPALDDWDHVTLATEGDYEVVALEPREEPTEPPGPGAGLEERFDRLGAPVLELTGTTPLDRLLAVQQVSVRSSDEGVVLQVSGEDPFLILPPLPPGAPRRLLIHLEMTAPGPTEVKIFYLTDRARDYSEQRAVRAPLQKGPNDVVLEIRHPRAGGRLRLDPGTRPGRYVLHRLEIRAEEP